MNAVGDSILGRYDVGRLTRLFGEEGVLAAVHNKGFSRPEVLVLRNGAALPHVHLYAHKDGANHLLLDACLTEFSLGAEVLAGHGHALSRALELVLIFWARQQDPSAVFSSDRPRLPLQAHPGLGILRQAFRVAARMAGELGKDGLANMPKFPHDALIFFRSLLFLYLDPEQQGRLEALWRDLEHLGLRDLSLAVAGGAVSDEQGRVVDWLPGPQVYPLSEVMAEYFRSEQYTRARAEARSRTRYRLSSERLRDALETFRIAGDLGSAVELAAVG